MTDSQKTEPLDQPVDPNIQLKFTAIFGILAIIPFVLFYFYGIERKPSGAASGTNAAPPVSFEDITAKSGLRFTHHNGAAGEKLLPETMGGGCAFLDYDNDGDQDILLVNSSDWPWTTNQSSATHALYANDGAGQFADVTTLAGLNFSSYGMGVAAGDFDGNGFVDLLITGVGGNRLLANQNGKFQDVTEQAGLGGRTNDWSTSAAFVDYDRDGDLDLFVCNYVQWSREIDLAVDYRLPGIGRAYGPPMNFNGSYPLLYRNEGNGTFRDVSVQAGLQIKNKATGQPLAKSLGVAPIDLDNDGWIDLVVANDTVQNFVFHNNKNGTFSEVGGRAGIAYDKFGSTRGAMGIDAGRFQDDDTLAISIGNFANESTAFYVSNRDPLVFSDEALEAGIGGPTRTSLTFGIFFFDYDLNGYLDLLTANGHIEPEIQKIYESQRYEQSAGLFWNTGRNDARFVPVSPDHAGPDLFSPLAGRGSAFADIDGDGDLDVLLTQVGGPPRLLRNNNDLKNNWVRLKLTGRGGNTDAIGSWVRVRVGGKWFSQQVMPTRGYLSQSELPVTIGLGAAPRPDEVQVIWPDGTRQDAVQAQANALTQVRQGATGTGATRR